MGSKAAEKLAELTTFLKVWFAAPKTVGAILPTSATSARKMVTLIDHSSSLPVLEIGPGTGAITRQILSSGTRPDNLVTLEVDPTFVRTLRERFPGIKIVQGDAFDLHSTFSRHGPVKFDTIISAMPLVTHPVKKRVVFLRQALSLLPMGRPLVIISYSRSPPIPAGLGGYSVERLATVFRNIPPSHLWLYRSTCDLNGIARALTGVENFDVETRQNHQSNGVSADDDVPLGCD